jgi:recombination protein RecA
MLNFAPLSTGSLALDAALGGGWPRRAFSWIQGDPQSGKTTLLLSALAQAQLGGPVAYLNCCGDFAPSLARQAGCNLRDLLVLTPSSYHAALEMTTALAANGRFAAIALDSIDCLPLDEPPVTSDPSHLFGAARQMFARYAGLCRYYLARTGTTILSALAWPPSATLSPFLNAGLCLQLRRGAALPGSPSPGFCTAVTCKQFSSTKFNGFGSKFPPPNSTIHLKIMYNVGIINFGDLFALGVQFGLITLDNAEFRFGGHRLGWQPSAAICALQANPLLAAEIESAVRARFVPPASG